VGSVDPRIFGGFIEHLARCIYGGIFDEGSPLSDSRGFRTDVLEAARGLRAPVLRWPGGNFASGYHWQDGIGPRDQRPRRLELAWHTVESNRFGTHEFIEYCRALDTEPIICANLGSGSMDEAQAWVEYCNGTSDTYWANLRRANGHEEPFNVRYWDLGNEMWGDWQIGALDAEDYVKKAREFAKVMKWTDPSIQLVACGRDGTSDWDRVVLDGLARYVDYHAIHIYTGSTDHYENVMYPEEADHALRKCAAMIAEVRQRQGIEHEIHVAYDEWGIWYRQHPGLEEAYTMSDAVAAAAYLNVFIRNCATMKMANLAQMVNVLAPISTSPEGMYMQAIYHPLRLYAEHVRGTAVRVEVEGPTHELKPAVDASDRIRRLAAMGPFQLLDVVATRDEAATRLTLAVVNRDRETAHQVEIDIAGTGVSGGTAHEVNAADLGAGNSFDSPNAVSVIERPIAASGHGWKYLFPAHSVSVLDIELAT
jgi:alpha-N-arabinofuranosidase